MTTDPLYLRIPLDAVTIIPKFAVDGVFGGLAIINLSKLPPVLAAAITAAMRDTPTLTITSTINGEPTDE